jgi:dihydroxyacetone kinase-like protein
MSGPEARRQKTGTTRGRGPQAAASGQTRPPLRFHDDPLLWASWLYYEEGLTQGEIAEAMAVSRPTVNSYLADARAAGIVNISIATERFKSLSVARQLQEHFGLEDCLVIPGEGGARSLIDRLGAAGAQVLERLIHSGDTVGITWGRTMLAVARAVRRGGLSDLRVVQATGGTTAVIPYTPEACATQLADSLGARCISISAPAIVSSAEARRILLAEPVVAEQVATLEAVNRIVFGISSLRPDSTIHQSGFFDSSLQQHDHYQSAVGSVAGRFIDAQGAPVEGPLGDRTIGIGLDRLRKVRTRVAIAGGYDKVPAMLAALRGGYAGILVTDAATGEGILRADGVETSAPRASRRARPDRPEIAPRTVIKKFLNAPRDAVSESLEGALRAFPDFIRPIDGSERAIRARGAVRDGKVGLVIGGGAGHEPCFLGYVGRGLADAVAVGNVFASPPPDRVLTCTRAASAGAGVLYIYGNYTGDVMNFEMAAEMAATDGIDVRTILTTDDVASSPPDQRQGRRATSSCSRWPARPATGCTGSTTANASRGRPTPRPSPWGSASNPARCPRPGAPASRSGRTRWKWASASMASPA